MAEMAGILRTLTMFWIAGLSLCGVFGLVNGFFSQPLAPVFSTVRQKSKSILLPTSTNNFREDSSHNTNNENRTLLQEPFWAEEKTEKNLLSHNMQLRNPAHLSDTSQTKSLCDRRSMARVATGRSLAMLFGGYATSTFLTANLPSQANAVTSLTTLDENRAQALAISSDQSLPIDNGDITDLPLEFIPTLDAYVVRYFLFGEPFAAIIDTGSPFLTVPCYCKPYRNRKMFWGCYKPELTRDSGYGNTIEGFDNNYGAYAKVEIGYVFDSSSFQH